MSQARTTGMSSQVPIGGGGIRAGGQGFFGLGILGLIVSIPLYIFAPLIPNFSFPFSTAVALFVVFTLFIIFGFILIGLYILPEWIRVPALRLACTRACGVQAFSG